MRIECKRCDGLLKQLEKRILSNEEQMILKNNLYNIKRFLLGDKAYQGHKHDIINQLDHVLDILKKHDMLWQI